MFSPRLLCQYEEYLGCGCLRLSSAAVLLLAGLGCTQSSVSIPSSTESTPTPASAHDGVTRPPPTESIWLDGARVKVFGRLGDPAFWVPVGHLLGPGNVYGVGQLAEHAGTVTFDDGQLFVSWAVDDSRIDSRLVKPGDRFGEGAAVLGVAQVSSWESATVSTPFELSDVARLVHELRGSGSGAAPVLFRLEGVADEVTFRVVGNPPPLQTPSVEVKKVVVVHRRRQSVAVRLVGIIGKSQQSSLLPPGSSAHVHVILRESSLTGHVERIRVASGACLMIPAVSSGKSCPDPLRKPRMVPGGT